MKDESFVSINISAIIKQRLKELAKQHDRSVASIVRMAILEFLERQK
jgi:predicted transcriptional regulator